MTIFRSRWLSLFKTGPCVLPLRLFSSINIQISLGTFPLELQSEDSVANTWTSILRTFSKLDSTQKYFNQPFYYFMSSTPQFNTSVLHQDHTFSVHKIPQFNSRNLLVWNWGVFGVKLRGVELRNVELRGFSCWTEGFLVSNWRGFWFGTEGCVELRGFKCGTEGFRGLKRSGPLVWNWYVELRGVWNWGGPLRNLLM